MKPKNTLLTKEQVLKIIREEDKFWGFIGGKVSLFVMTLRQRLQIKVQTLFFIPSANIQIDKYIYLLLL